MPAAPYVRPRFPQAPFPITNSTNPVPTRETTTEEAGPSKTNDDNPPDRSQPQAQTPTFIPIASYVPVQVVPASEVAATTTPHASIEEYKGPGAIILRGYCTEPNYTILDGPTALWVPVVGCVSSKAECCPTSTIDGGANAAPTETGKPNASVAPSAAAGGAGLAAFPISALPSQGTLTGCPKDYHTVKASEGAGCCPSSYWLWSTTLGGQVPCYSSLGAALVPPPMPDSFGRMNLPSSVSASTSVVAQTMQAKPTLAIVNIAYAMQYQLAPEPEPITGLKKEAKIGIGVGVTAGALFILVVLGFLVRRCLGKRKSNEGDMQTTTPSQRFGSQIDMSRVAHEPPGVARTYGGVRYTGVATRPMEY
ncbi:hypothetical protein BKA66DRAFT_573194 [Pyrenochaeta sp. MPI-SDFR-AT-0127]|nr:hypothetical protein BKA66DRAFT_573194 [Pyrenochaeta sp. MPI-SDFR-AT-0127]